MVSLDLDLFEELYPYPVHGQVGLRLASDYVPDLLKQVQRMQCMMVLPFQKLGHSLV